MQSSYFIIGKSRAKVIFVKMASMHKFGGVRVLPLLPASMMRRQQEEEEECETSCAVGDHVGGEVEVEATTEEAFTEVKKRRVDDQRGSVPTSSDGAHQVPFIHDIRSLKPFPLSRGWLVTSVSLLRQLSPTSTQVSFHLNKL